MIKKFPLLALTLILLTISLYPLRTHGQIETPTPIFPSAASDSSVIFFPILTKSVVIKPSGPVVIDHTSVELFEHIPVRYLTAARNLRLLFSDRSVGANINAALDCLASASWAESPSYCRVDYTDADWNWRTFNANDLNLGIVPDRIFFPANSNIYSRANWTFEFRGGSWSDLTDDFINSLAPQYLNSKDVLTYQFSYLNVQEFSNISDPQNGFFANNPNKYDIFDLEAFWELHPDKIFFLWTTSLARNIGTQTAMDFNNQMRQYAYANNKILFDVADIESHTDQGVPCYDNRDGIEYINVSNPSDSENYPDDGLNIPAICQDYTTEAEGGHLGSVSAGMIQIAKAYWVLMAQIAGWDGISQ